MRILALTVVFMSVSGNLAAQELDRSLERIMLALERPPLIIRDQPSEQSQRTMERQVLGSPRGSCEDLRGSTDAVDGEGETLCPQSVDQYVTHRGRGGKHARSVG